MNAAFTRAATAYKEVAVTSRSPLELVVMLYDGALASMAAGREALVRRDLPAKRDHFSKALAIIAQLQSSLDMEGGGEIAENLDRLYAYACQRLIESSATLNPDGIDEATRLLSSLRQAWAQIATAPASVPQPTAMAADPR